MAFVYRRSDGRFWWMCWTDANGVEQRASAKTENEAEAKALANELEGQARSGARRQVLNALTVRRFYDETWLPLRQRTRPWAWKTDAGVMKRHFLPHFGARAIADLATDAGEVALLDWVVGLREHRSKRDGTTIAPRTVRNVASAVRVFFADAAERKVVRRNPTAGWNAERHLPAIEDKQRGWRERAGFSIAQVVSLTTDVRIPEDRRVLYALRFLGGPRPGEAANARWRNLDQARRPLWCLTLEAAFNSPMRREKSTKTGATLHIPIHPVLQGMLEDWWSEGWARFMGRAPEPEDLIFPREDGKHRLVSGTYKQFNQDLETLGLPAQRQYESRSTFRNLALSAGASEFHVNLITHPKPKRASDYYTRLEMQWPGMCEAVLAIDPAAWAGASIGAAGDEVTVEVTDRVTVEGTTKEKPPTSLGKSGVTLEREKGFESAPGPVSTDTYAAGDAAGSGPTQPADASGRVGTELDGSAGADLPDPLPASSRRVRDSQPMLQLVASAVEPTTFSRRRPPRSFTHRRARRDVRGEVAGSNRGLILPSEFLAPGPIFFFMPRLRGARL